MRLNISLLAPDTFVLWTVDHAAQVDSAKIFSAPSVKKFGLSVLETKPIAGCWFLSICYLMFSQYYATFLHQTNGLAAGCLSHSWLTELLCSLLSDQLNA